MKNDVMVNLTGTKTTLGAGVATKWSESGVSVEGLRAAWSNETEAGAFAHSVQWEKDGEKFSVNSDIGARFDLENHSWLFRL